MGGAGDDTLRGQFGSDKLYGENGDDNLRGWDGNDRLYGGNGLDAIGGDNGDDKIYGGAGVDILNGHSGNDRLEGDAGEDELNGGAGNDILLGGDDNDFLRGEVGADRIYGEDGDDIFRGGDGADRLYGGNGRDIIGGDDGGDRIYGEDGKDTLKGGGDNDFLYGGNGDDVINGGAGNDIVAGQADNDSLYGDSGIDKLYGGAGRDGLFGGVGGGDRLAGGENDDRFLTFAEGSTGTPVVLDTITDLSNEDVEVLIVDNLTPAVTGNLLVGQTWADDEVQLVDASLRNLHLHISNANLLRYSSDESNWLFKFNTSLNAAGVNYRYLPIIGIAADAFTAYPYYVDEIVYHEIGHNFDEQYENRFINDFRAISNWDTTQDPGDTLSRDGNWYYNDTADNFFWYYATTNPYEDYAVTFNHYFQTEYHGYNYDPATGVTPAKFANVEQFLNLLDG